MRVDKAFSNKIKVLSFIATIFVVLIHSDATAVGGVAAWNVLVHDFFTKQIAGLAVPFFFAVSGFWFARGYCTSDVVYLPFIKKKLKTLVIPYIIFSIIGLPFVLGYHGYWNYLHGLSIFNGTCLESCNIVEAVNRIFAIYRCDSPEGNGPLWYVRALLIIFLFAPFWRLLYQRCHWLLFIGFIFIVMFAPGELLPGITLRYGRASYFLLGMFVAHYKFEGWTISVRLETILLCFLIPIFVFSAYYKAYNYPMPIWFRYVMLLRTPIGLAAFWFGYDFLVGKRLITSDLPEWLNYSFLIYCMHGPLEIITVALPRFLFWKNDYVVLMITVVSVVVIVIACIRFATFLRRVKPSLLSVLCGGRG